MGVSTNAYLTFGIDLGESVDWMHLADSLLGEDHGWDVDRDPEEILDQLGLCLKRHCSLESPMFIVSAAGHFTAWRGEPTKVDPGELPTATPDQLAALKRVAKAAGVKDEPAWLLYSMWG
jgi:hypothetical protein